MECNRCGEYLLELSRTCLFLFLLRATDTRKTYRLIV